MSWTAPNAIRTTARSYPRHGKGYEVSSSVGGALNVSSHWMVSRIGSIRCSTSCHRVATSLNCCSGQAAVSIQSPISLLNRLKALSILGPCAKVLLLLAVCARTSLVGKHAAILFSKEGAGKGGSRNVDDLDRLQHACERASIGWHHTRDLLDILFIQGADVFATQRTRLRGPRSSRIRFA